MASGFRTKGQAGVRSLFGRQEPHGAVPAADKSLRAHPGSASSPQQDRQGQAKHQGWGHSLPGWFCPRWSRVRLLFSCWDSSAVDRHPQNSSLRQLRPAHCSPSELREKPKMKREPKKGGKKGPLPGQRASSPQSQHHMGKSHKVLGWGDFKNTQHHTHTHTQGPWLGEIWNTRTLWITLPARNSLRKAEFPCFKWTRNVFMGNMLEPNMFLGSLSEQFCVKWNSVTQRTGCSWNIPKFMLSEGVKQPLNSPFLAGIFRGVYIIQQKRLFWHLLMKHWINVWGSIPTKMIQWFNCPSRENISSLNIYIYFLHIFYVYMCRARSWAHDPCGSLLAQDIPSFYDSIFTA